MWRSIGARAIGSAHLLTGINCQDSFAHTRLTADVLGIAVADGAGSAASSLLGADAAVENALTELRRFPDLASGDEPAWTEAMNAAFRAAREAVFTLAVQNNAVPREFATTLQVLLVRPSAYCYGRVGDGGSVGFVDGELVALGPPPQNTYVNETTFLTCEQAVPEVQFREGHVEACAVFTDGLQHLAMRLVEWIPHRPFFDPLFQFARTNTNEPLAAKDQLEAYLRSERMDQRTDDDRTLVIGIWNHGF